MSFFSHFSKSVSGRTAIGKHWVDLKDSKVLAIIHKYCNHPNSMLEVGPGSGDFARQWRDAGGGYVGIEGDEAMALMLRRDKFAIVNGLVPPLPFFSGSFDIVYSANVMEHMPTFCEADSLISEASRVLRPGGVVCIDAPDFKRWGRDFWLADFSHNYVTTSDRVKQIMTNSGFEILEAKDFSGPYTGLFGKFLSRAAYWLPLNMVYFLLMKKVKMETLYKGKLTFLGSFLVIGRKL